jgi:PTH1 family peptidyl-tRNA hydrolase
VFSHVVVGLGNPGFKYQKTRHNVGFVVLDQLAVRYGVTFEKDEESHFFSVLNLLSNRILLVKPTTYMNLSGNAVAGVMEACSVELSKILVVFDDFYLPFGEIRFRSKGRSAGHNGIQSIIDSVGSNQFHRLKIGIGSEVSADSSAEFVLSNFDDWESKNLNKIIELSTDAIVSWVIGGLDKTMNKFNRNILIQESEENNLAGG